MSRHGENRSLHEVSIGITSSLGYTCGVCLEYVPLHAYQSPTSTCQHGRNVCDPCLSRSISSNVQEGLEPLCPFVGCNTRLSQAEIKLHMTAGTFETYNRRKFLKSISHIPEFRWCLSTNCGSGQIHQDGDQTPIVTCTVCSAMSCYRHLVPWHSEITCEEYDDRVEENMRGDLMSLATLQKISKPCPGHRCGIRIEKRGGCDSMTCGKCGYKFCWLCLADQRVIFDQGNHRHETTCPHWREWIGGPPNESVTRPMVVPTVAPIAYRPVSMVAPAFIPTTGRTTHTLGNQPSSTIIPTVSPEITPLGRSISMAPVIVPTNHGAFDTATNIAPMALLTAIPIVAPTAKVSTPRVLNGPIPIPTYGVHTSGTARTSTPITPPTDTCPIIVEPTIDTPLASCETNPTNSPANGHGNVTDTRTLNAQPTVPWGDTLLDGPYFSLEDAHHMVNPGPGPHSQDRLALASAIWVLNSYDRFDLHCHHSYHVYDSRPVDARAATVSSTEATQQSMRSNVPSVKNSGVCVWIRLLWGVYWLFFFKVIFYLAITWLSKYRLFTGTRYSTYLQNTHLHAENLFKSSLHLIFYGINFSIWVPSYRRVLGVRVSTVARWASDLLYFKIVSE